MASLLEIIGYLDNLLKIGSFPSDSSNNGLQVEGKAEVRKVLFGVDSCLKLFDRAADENADMVFVHHGISWRDSLKRLTGRNAKLVGPLLKKGISLYAAHLPLDASPEIGHNILLAKMLSLRNVVKFAKYADSEIGFKGAAPKGSTVAKFAETLDRGLGGRSRMFGSPSAKISKCGIVSGAGGNSCLLQAIDAGLDCFVTGEVGHDSFHLIEESGINVIAAGHYASEKPGVLAVMRKLSSKFRINCEFVELPTGM